jgi:1,2-phenylacetyl-CoA epoxidase catalytic subunit
MAQRARKILQEEGSHRVHGEAWAKRLCRGDHRDAFVARLQETWEHAGRWIGPDDDPECAAALEAGEIVKSPAEQREMMRAWLTELLAAENVTIELPELTWDGWDAERRRWEP